MKAVILAGGIGSRLWPMYRSKRPKQFNHLVSDEPLIREVYRRLLRSFPAEKIYFSISPAFDELIHEAFPEIEDDHILVEPEKRDTAPAMGYVAALLGLDDPDEPIVFVPSDHNIQDEELFLKVLQVGDEFIQKTGKLLDIAITPTFPETALGYTRIGEKFGSVDGVEVYKFAGHTEKPPLEVAKQYLEEGSYLWHANYYMWTPEKFLKAFESYSPEDGKVLRQIQEAFMKADFGLVGELYSQLSKTSFDYAITEKMNPEDVLILKGDFGWSDIGAWDTLHDHLSDNGSNVQKGKGLLLDTEGSLVYTPKDKKVAIVGMKDVVVVDTGDALLVCKKSDSQRLKEVVSYLKENGHDDVL